MIVRRRIILFAMALKTLALASCVFKHSNKASVPVKPDVQVSLQQREARLTTSIESVRTQKLSLADEYDAYKTALAEYKETDFYQNPKTDADIAIRDLVYASDQVTLDKVKELMKEKKFTLYLQRIQKNLPEYQETAEGLVSSDKGTLSLAEEQEKRTALQFNTGIFLTVTGAIGFINGYNQIVDMNVAGGNAPGRMGAFMAASIFTAFPLVIGSLIIAKDEKPNDDVLRAAKANIAIGAAIFAGATIASGVVYMANRGVNNTKAIALKSAGRTGFLVFGALAAAFGIWAHELSLAETNMTPQQKVSSKVGRAFIAWQQLELKS